MFAEQVAREVRRLSRGALWSPEPGDQAHAVVGDAIERLVPHRAPFRLVDAVLAAQVDTGRVLAIRRVDPSDPVFAGHFPGAPVYPGVLVVEAMGQAALCGLALRTHGGLPPVDVPPAAVRVTRVHHAVFLDAVRPDDTVELLAEILEEDSLSVLVATQARRPGGAVCAAALLEVYLA